MAESKSAHCNLTKKIANLNIFDECLKLDFAQKDKAATAEWVSQIGQLQGYLFFSLNPEVFFALLKIVLFMKISLDKIVELHT